MCNLAVGTFSRLPVRSSPRTDESLLGYVVRLADLNSYDTPTWIFRLADMKPASLTKGTVLFEKNTNYGKLAQLAWASSEEVERLSYRVIAGKKATEICNFLGTSVKRSALNWMHAKVCPHCLKSNPYMRAIWDLSIATTCPIHHCLLMDFCPHCKKKITSSRRRIIYCNCGYNLTDFSPPQVDEIQTGITKMVWNLCGLQCKQLDKSFTTPLSEMSMEELYNTLELTANVASGYEFSSHKQSLSINSKNIEIHQLLTKVYKAFFNWPVAFEAMLDDRLLAENRNTTKIPNAYSSKLITALVRRLTIKGTTGQPRRKVETMCKGVANYICRTNGTIKDNWRLAPYADARNMYLTKNTASKELNIQYYAVAQLIKSGIIRTKKFPIGKSFRLLIEPASFYDYKKRHDQFLTSHEVAEVLRVSRLQVRRLVQYKILNPICGPGISKQMDWRFDQEEVNKLIADISKQAPESNTSSSEKWLTMAQAACLSRSVNIFTSQLLRLVAEGKCTALRIQGSAGLSGLRISKENLKAICLQEANRKSPHHWTVGRIAQTFKVKLAAIRQFINLGYIRATKIDRKNRHGVASNLPRYCISSEDFEDFKAKFIFPSEVAEKYGLTLRITSILLKLSGIVPVSSPNNGMSGSYLFRRTEVDAVGSNFMSSSAARRSLWSAKRYYKNRVKAH